MTNLYFSILAGRLWGSIGAETVNMHGVVGGRGGSKIKGAADTSVANNPFKMCQKTDHTANPPVHGGPLPIGTYRLGSPGPHGHLGLSIPLNMSGGFYPFGNCGRDGFYIHGQGPHGSDGCIVLAYSDLQKLKTLLTKTPGGTLVVLP